MSGENSDSVVADPVTDHAGGRSLDAPSPDADVSVPAGARPRAIDLRVIGAAVGGWGVIVLAFWVVFAGDPGMVETLLAVSGVSVVIVGMICGLGYLANQTRFPSDRPVHVSFSEFLRSDVQTCTGHLQGRDLLLLVGGISAGLAAGGVGFAIIVALVS
ncbi:MAG: hypothetical protein ACREFO_15505 [Acetobacteraceae bacterium]